MGGPNLVVANVLTDEAQAAGGHVGNEISKSAWKGTVKLNDVRCLSSFGECVRCPLRQFASTIGQLVGRQPQLRCRTGPGVPAGEHAIVAAALNGYQGRTSSHGGAHAGKWPVSVDTGDVSRVWFQDPSEHRWHPLAWEHAAELGRPFSAEAAAQARRLAPATHRFPDTKRALVELLERWDGGLTASPAERRMAVRLSAGQLRLTGDDVPAAGAVSALPSVARIAALSAFTASRRDGQVPAAATNDAAGDLAARDLGGDDDEEAECDVAFPGEGGPGGEDFYADVLESS